MIKRFPINNLWTVVQGFDKNLLSLDKAGLSQDAVFPAPENVSGKSCGAASDYSSGELRVNTAPKDDCVDAPFSDLYENFDDGQSVDLSDQSDENVSSSQPGENGSCENCAPKKPGENSENRESLNWCESRETAELDFNAASFSESEKRDDSDSLQLTDERESQAENVSDKARTEICALLPHAAVPLGDGPVCPDSLTGIFTYTRTLFVPASSAGCRVRLAFEGIEGYAEVYVNGMYVAAHKGGTPFTADVTAPVKFDYQNTVAVKVDSRVKKDVPTAGKEEKSLAFTAFGKVELEIIDGPFIEDVFVKTSGQTVEAAVTLGDYYPDCELFAQILTPDGAAVSKLPVKAVLKSETVLKGEIKELKKWSPESPYLYAARVCLTSEGRTLDTFEVAFGAREAKFCRDGFYLNGKKTFLKGVVREGVFPVFGKAAPDALQREDAHFIKNSLGCNFVRNIGFPAPAFSDECARIGLMLIVEPSGDGYVGGAARREAFVNLISETVQALRSNPAVISFGVRPEAAPDLDELFFKANKAVHDLDGTRQTVGTRGFMKSRMYEDVFGYAEHSPPGTVSRLKGTARLSVPYLISSFSAGEGGELKSALNLLKTLDASMKKRCVCGAAADSFCDYAIRPDLLYGGLFEGGLSDCYRLLKIPGRAYSGEPYAVMSPDSKLYVFGEFDSVKLYRDGGTVGTFFPDRKSFENLPHPPAVITDFIGSLLLTKEGFTAWQSETFKKLAAKAKRRGLYNLCGTDGLTAFALRKSLKLSAEEFFALLKSYLKTDCELKVEAVKAGAVIKTVTLAPGADGTLTLSAPARIVCRGGFEAARVTAEVITPSGLPLAGENCCVKLSASGSVALAGAENISLKEGRAAFFVRTVSEGEGVITAECERGTATIKTEVRYE